MSKDTTYKKKYIFIQKRYNPKSEEKTHQDPANVARIKKVIGLIPAFSQTILDVGCYDGRISVVMQRKTSGDIYGIELNLLSCKEASKKGIVCIQSDVEGIFPFRSESFDVVFAGEIIEHVYDPDFFVSEVFRVLKRGGYFILTTPNLTSLGARISLLIGKRPFFIEPRITEGSAGHLRYFTLDDLIELLKDHQFEVEKVYGSMVKIGPLHLGRVSEYLGKILPRLAVHLIIRAKKK